MTRYGIAIAAVAAFAVAGEAAAQRDNVSVAGSSTVRPYAEIVAEAFGEAFPEFSVVVEGGGSSGGLRRFCEGVGPEFIDVANASRAIRSSEIERCAENGVTEIIEVRIGYDGIVFAYDINQPTMEFEPIDIYRALAAQIIVDGELVDNPYTNLQDIHAEFADMDITFYIPASNHGTREVFEENVILVGCELSGDMAAMMALGMSEDDAEEQCLTFRTDGAVVEIAGDYTETLARVDSNRDGVGVFGLAFYENNRDRLQVADISGVTPSQATIASGVYPVSRPLFFYVKAAHLDVIPGLQEYVEFFASDEMTGPGSPTVSYGLVAAPDGERDATRAAIVSRDTL